MQLHFAERYKRKIRELEADRERLENRLIEEHAENILLREEFCRLQSTVKTLSDAQRSMENENLRLRSELMNEQFKNEKLESDLARKQELEQAFMNLQAEHHEWGLIADHFWNSSSHREAGKAIFQEIT